MDTCSINLLNILIAKYQNYTEWVPNTTKVNIHGNVINSTTTCNRLIVNINVVNFRTTALYSITYLPFIQYFLNPLYTPQYLT